MESVVQAVISQSFLLEKVPAMCCGQEKGKKGGGCGGSGVG